VNVRILAATHRDLDAAAADGSFREDLLYRLRVVPIEVPPLRERTDDIAPLVDHFLHRYDQELTGGSHGVSAETMERLSSHPWPGNVRELENAIKRALVLADSDVPTPEDFAFLEGATRPSAPAGAGLEELVIGEVEDALSADDGGEIYRDVMTRVERPLIETVLARTAGNQIRAAALLGINRNTLRKKITDLGLEVPPRP
jgi:two-component system nitrogen regulation response regulator GlnG